MDFLVVRERPTFVSLGKHREWAVGCPRGRANLPEWSRNDLEKKMVSRIVNIFDFNVYLREFLELPQARQLQEAV